MCGRYELKTQFKKLPCLLRKELPQNFQENFSSQEIIRPSDPVIVLKNEGKTSTSIMIWGLISQWSKDPFNTVTPRPFNARSETVMKKKIFRNSWNYKRCLLPATAFFEKGYRIRKKDSTPFWLGGIWSRWMSLDGSELESCCVLTTEPNELIKPLHNRMPVIIPNGLEEKWIMQTKNKSELNELETLLKKWDHFDWMAEPVRRLNNSQMNFFNSLIIEKSN